MKKNVLALAIGAAMTAAYVPAAMAEVKVSGRVHMSVDHMDNGASGAAASSGIDVGSNSSRLRFSAKKDVVEGLTALMQYESGVRPDQGGGSLLSRDSFFGLKGDFGTVRLGMFDTPTKKVRSFTDMFGDRVGDARNMTAGFDNRFKNSIHYKTPAMSGLVFDIQYSANNENDVDKKAKLDNDKDAMSMALTYKAGPLTAMVAHESIGDGPDKDKKAATRLGATYNVAKGFRVAGFYQAQNKAGGDRSTMGVGSYYDLTSEYRLRGQVYTVSDAGNAKDTGAMMMAVGVDRRFKDLTLYAVYANTSNDKNAKFSAVGGGHDSQIATVNGENVSAISLGAIYNF